VGQWYSNGQCSNGTSTSPSSFNFSGGYYADNYSNSSSLVISQVGRPKMREFFKLGMGVCDRGAKNYQNVGSANCDYYLDGYIDMILQFPQQQNGKALVTFIAKPRQNPYGSYSGQLPSGWGLLGIAIGYVTGINIPDPSYYQGPTRNPLQIQMDVTPSNNNAGFTASGYADAWTGYNNTLVSVEVLNGSSNSNTLNYSILIQNQPAAQGTMNRCQTTNCGL
jgi:hypothetical protein